jgi:Domain of unknown function (DUF4062)
MPRSITQYRVFIGSPSGLEDERKAFKDALEAYTASDAEPRMVTFHPVGWEDTLPGAGRPQGLINEDIKQCDYAIFVWHDRWGSCTSSRRSFISAGKCVTSRCSSKRSMNANCGTQANN